MPSLLSTNKLLSAKWALMQASAVTYNAVKVDAFITKPAQSTGQRMSIFLGFRQLTYMPPGPVPIVPWSSSLLRDHCCRFRLISSALVVRGCILSSAVLPARGLAFQIQAERAVA